MQRIESLPNSLMEVMQVAWREAKPQTVSQLHIVLNEDRKKRALKPYAFTSVVKAADQLVDLRFLSKEKCGTAPSAYSIAISKEQYVAAAVNSVSQRILGYTLGDVLPRLIGQNRQSPAQPTSSSPTPPSLRRSNAIGLVVNEPITAEPDMDTINALVEAISAVREENQDA